MAPRSGKYGVLRLTTTGRSSGEPRNVIIGYYEDGPSADEHDLGPQRPVFTPGRSRLSTTYRTSGPLDLPLGCPLRHETTSDVGRSCR